MMNRNIFLKGILSTKVDLNSITKRTHVKISPWRTKRNKRECYLDPTEKPYTDRHNPAEFMRENKKLKPWQQVICKDKDSRFNDYVWHDAFVSDPKKAKKTSTEKMASFEQSIKARGQPRESKPYNPPENVEDSILQLFDSEQANGQNNVTSSNKNSILATNLEKDREMKFNLITKCIEIFKHDVPCSYLNELLTVQSLVDYFSTPVIGINPYAAMVRNDDSLPTNLNLIPEVERFNMETDTFFKGYTAYPGLVSQVPGLRGKKKYPVLNQQEFQWPDI